MNAGIDTLHVDAGIVSWAVAVAVATDHSATIQRISIIALTTSTVGFVVVGEAFRVHSAVIGNQTRIHAVVVHATLVQGTFAVACTFHGVASDVWVALVAFIAGADRFVVSYIARGVGTTVARISTLPVDAGFCVAALVVRRTGTDYRYLDWKMNYFL